MASVSPLWILFLWLTSGSSIMHRLPSTERGQKPLLNTVQPDLHPVEILFDVKKLMQVQNVRDSPNKRNVRPTQSSRNNRYQRLSRRYISSLGGTTSGLTFMVTFYVSGTKMLFMLFIPLSGASQVCVSMLFERRVNRPPGCGQLSTLEEQLVLIFTEVRSDDNNRLTVTINQAYKVRIFPTLLPRSCHRARETEGSEW